MPMLRGGELRKIVDKARSATPCDTRLMAGVETCAAGSSFLGRSGFRRHRRTTRRNWTGWRWKAVHSPVQTGGVIVAFAGLYSGNQQGAGKRHDAIFTAIDDHRRLAECRARCWVWLLRYLLSARPLALPSDGLVWRCFSVRFGGRPSCWRMPSPPI